MPQQQAPTPRGREATQATPYQQQVFPPKTPCPQTECHPQCQPGSLEAPTGRPQQQSDGPDGQLSGLRVETRSHPFHRLLLGGPDRFPGTGRVACGHHQIPRGNGQTEGQRVDRYKRN